jgi:hypothetical protein
MYLIGDGTTSSNPCDLLAHLALWLRIEQYKQLPEHPEYGLHFNGTGHINLSVPSHMKSGRW